MLCHFVMSHWVPVLLCFTPQGVDVVAAHGDKDQQERLDAVRDFKLGAQHSTALTDMLGSASHARVAASQGL
jgi:hypothetical protein